MKRALAGKSTCFELACKEHGLVSLLALSLHEKSLHERNMHGTKKQYMGHVGVESDTGRKTWDMLRCILIRSRKPGTCYGGCLHDMSLLETQLPAYTSLNEPSMDW